MSLPSGGPLYAWWQTQALITLPFANDGDQAALAAPVTLRAPGPRG